MAADEGMASSSRTRRFAVQRGRAGLVWGLVFFATLQLGLAVAIELWLPELRDPQYAYKAARLRQRMAADRDDRDDRPRNIVVLGSSRTMFGLQGERAERVMGSRLGRPVTVFNFGMVGAGPITQLVDLKRLLAQGIRPDLLVIEVLPPLL